MYLSSSCERTPSPPSIMGSYNHPGPSKPNLSLKKKRNMKEKFDSYLSHYTCKKKQLGMPNHSSQDASLSGKLMFTRTPYVILVVTFASCNGFHIPTYNPPPKSVVSFAKNYPCLNLDDCGMVFSRFLQKGFGPLMAMLMGPGLKKKRTSEWPVDSGNPLKS